MMDESKWEKIVTMELLYYMRSVSGESEDSDSIERFFEFLQQRVEDHRVLMALARNWKSHDEQKQVSLAVEHAGMYHVSRFFMLMEYMASKIEKGQLREG